MARPQITLTERIFAESVKHLAARDADLAQVIDTYGQPSLWVREPGFPTLVYIILEQQVSLASAKAAFDRLNDAVRPLTPSGFLKLTDAKLLRIGYSRQKTLYTRLLAESLSRRHFDLRYLHELHDDAARKMLVTFKGIGHWTADIYLLSALRRPDIWPVGDLALAKAVQEVKRLRKRLRPKSWKKCPPSGSRIELLPRACSGMLIFRNAEKIQLLSVFEAKSRNWAIARLQFRDSCSDSRGFVGNENESRVITFAQERL